MEMSSTTSTTTPSNPLRRRLFSLERARSEATSTNPNLSPRSEDSLFTMSPHSQPDDISEIDSTEIEDAGGLAFQPASTSRTSLPVRSARRMKEWYEFDRTVLLVLISPIGSWVTGNGEWIRDLILVVLGVYYLHQIIEVPWNLYMASLPPSTSPAEDTTKLLAARKELRRIELFLLALTVLSPFAGTVFLKYILYLVTGSTESLSWFSTSLFVLTCGVRPWKHLVDRIDGRVSHLQSTFHPPDALDSAQEMQELRQRLEQLENLLHKDTEELYSYVDEAVDSLEATVRRHERKWEKHQTRLTRAETSIANVAMETKAFPPNSAIDLVSRLSVVSAFIPATKQKAPAASTPARSYTTRPRISSNGHTKRLETILEETRARPPPLANSNRSVPSKVLEPLFNLMTLPFWPAMWLLGQASNLVFGKGR